MCVCAECGVRFGHSKPGRPPKFCTPACGSRARVRKHRARQLPAELTGRVQWTRRVGKRPVMVDGSPASSTRPATWSTYRAVKSSAVGDGFGVMLGRGLACIDLDGCLDGDDLAAWARDAIDVEPVWVERSLSGTGLHVFHLAPEAPGTMRDGVERYSRARFIAVTGERFVL